MPTDTLREEKLKVAHSLKTFGGSFHNTLGKLLVQADSDNTKRIKEAFPEDWERYLNMHQFTERTR